MTDPKNKSPDFSDLRRRAEERAEAEAVSPEDLSPAEAARLIHELQVYQIELEMQNDELRQAQAELAESRDKYADLYDFAPVGYLTLDKAGRILEANLTAATMLGMERSKLLEHFFPLFLVEADRRLLRQLLNDSVNHPERRGEFHLENGNGDLRVVLLDILFLQDAQGRERRRVALTDITELKRTQEELRLHKEDQEELVAERTAELIEANEQLREANEKLRVLIDNSPLTILHLDNQGTILTWNPAAEHMFGWSAAEVVGRHLPMVPEEKREESAGIIQRIRQGEQVTGLEVRRRRKDGAWIDLSLSIAPIYDAQGQVSGMVDIAEDITERKKLEEALRTQARVLDSMAEGVTVTDGRGNILYANPAFDAMFGYEPGELLGRHSNILNYYKPEENLRVVKEILRQVEAAGVWSGEFHNRKKDGSPFLTSARISALEVQGKKLFISVQEDITERKRAEAAVKKAKEEWERTFDAVEDYIAILDKDHRVIRMNRAMAELLGGEPEKVHGLPCYKAVHGLDEAPDFCPHTRVVATGQTQFEEVHEFGRIFAVSVTPLLSSDQELIGSVHVARDITEEKAAQEEIRRLATFPELNPNPVLEVNEQGGIVYANPGARKAAAELALPGGVQDFLPANLQQVFADARQGGPRQYFYDREFGDAFYAVTLHLPHDLPTARLYALNITQRQKVERELKESEAKFRSLFEHMAEGVALHEIIYDDQGTAVDYRVLAINPAFTVHTDFKPERVVGRLASQVYGSGEPPYLETFARVARTGEAYSFETYYPPLKRHFSISVSSSRPGQFFTVFEDITERKAAEQALKESEARLRLAQQAARIGTFELNLQTGANTWTPELEAMYGLVPGSFAQTQTAWENLIHPEDRAEAISRVQQAFETGEPTEGEWRVTWPDGSVHWLTGRWQVFKDESGQPLRMTGVNIDITERKRTEEALRESEERLRLALDAAYLISFEWDIQRNEVRRFTSADPALVTTPEETPSTFEALQEIVHPEDRELFTANVLAAIEHQEGRYENEYRIVHPDGKVAWLYERGYVKRDKQGRPARLIGLSQEITERKAAEQALQESREDLNRAQAVAHTGSWRLDVRLNELTWSDENHRIFGIPLGMPQTYETFLNIVHPEDREYVDRKWTAALRGEPYDIEHRILVNGEVKWVRERAELEFDPEGRLLGGFGTTQDITERKRMEGALRESEELFRKVFENAATGIAITDWEGRFLQANPAQCKLLGYTTEELRRLNFASLIHPEDREANVAEIRRLQTGELPYFEVENRYRNKHGQSVWVHKFVSVLTDTEGRPAHMVALVTDVTERKQAEEALKRQHNLTQGINRVLHEALTCETEEDLGRTCLAVAEELSGSKFGFLAEINQDNLLDTIAVSDPGWEACTVPGTRDVVLPVGMHIHGLYGRVAAEGQSLIANDPASHPDSIGVPEGHPQLSAFLGVPLKQGGATIGMIGLGNKPGGYNLSDQDAVEALSVAFVEAFQRQRAENALRRAHDELEQRVEERTAALRLANEQLLWEMEERQVAENRLRESEARFAAFMKHLPGLAVMRDVQGRCVFANETWERLTGKPREDWQGKLLEEIWPRDEARKFHKLDQQVLLAGEPLEALETMELADGLHYFLSYRFPIQDQDGLPYMVGVVGIDITARQRAEEALAAERQRLFSLLENIPAFVYLQAPDYSVRFANRQFRESFGDPEGGPCYTLMWGRDHPCPECPTFQVFHTGFPCDWEWQAPDGRFYQIYDYPFADVDGSPLVLEMGIDITARKQAKEALEKERQRLFAVLETMPAYVALLAPDYTVPFANQEFIRRFGQAEKGQRCYEFLFGLQEPCPDCRTFKVLETNQPEQWEWLGPDGQTYAVYDYPFTDTDGNPLVLEMGVDITDRKRAEEALRQNEAMLRLILDTLPVGVYVADREGMITLGNPAGRRIWGGARYVGLERYGEYKAWWADTGKPIAAEEWALARAVQKGESSLGEIIDIEGFDGTRKTIRNSAVPLRGPNQEVLGGIAVIEDITEARRAEKLIQEQARQLEAFFDYSITPLVFLDPEFNFIRVNQAYARACHREVSEFAGRNHSDLYPSDAQQIFEEVVRSKIPYVAVARPFVYPDNPEWGVTYWDWSLVPILSEAGEVDFLVFSLKDVTDRVHAEEERNRLVEILENTTDFVGIADFYGNLLYLNRAGRTMVGVDRDEDVSNLKVLQLHPDWVGELILQEGAPAARREGAWEAETTLLHRDGREIPVSQVILAHKNASGRVEFFSTIARDISALKEAQESILRQANILNGINRILREALASETEEELGRTCLAVAEELTDSRFGFIDELNDEGNFDALAFSDPGWDLCNIPEVTQALHLKNIRPVGLTGKSIREGRAVIANDPSTHPDAAGVPEGHPPLTAYLGMPLRLGERIIGLIGLGNKAGGYSLADQEALESLAPSIVEALSHHRSKEALQKSERRLRHLADQLLTAQEHERKRLAAELHDELGHALLTLKLAFSSIAKELHPDQAILKQEIQEQLEYINEVIEEVRRLYHDLSPGDLEDLGLTKALGSLIEDFAHYQPHITWKIDLPDLTRLFSLPVQTIIYRTFQEALTNIGKHANPEHVTVLAKKEPSRVSFAIQDDGAGFDMVEVMEASAGLGLAAMEERLNMIGGAFEVWSRKKEGTRLSFSIPTLPEDER